MNNKNNALAIKKKLNQDSWIEKIGCIPKLGTRFKFDGQLCEVTWIDEKSGYSIQACVIVDGKLNYPNGCIERLTPRLKGLERA